MVWRTRDKFISKLGVRHCCSAAAGGASIKRTASKELFEKGATLEPLSGLLPCRTDGVCVCASVCVLRNLLCEMKERDGGRRRRQSEGGGGLCNVNSSSKLKPTTLLHSFKRA